jgi:PAS domain S-box-containing protein
MGEGDQADISSMGQRIPLWLRAQVRLHTDLAFGPAPADYRFSGRSYSHLRLLAGIYATIMHLVLATVWDWQAGFVVAGFAALYWLIVIPLTARRTISFPPMAIDGILVMTGIAVSGTRSIALGWLPLLLFAGLLWVPGRLAAGMIALTGALLVVGTILSDTLAFFASLSAERQITYLAIMAPLWLVFTMGLVGVVGAAMNKREIELQQQRAEKEEVTERARKLVTELPIGVALRGGDGKVIFVNRAFAEILGITQEQVLAHDYAAVFEEARLAQLEEQLREARISGRRFTAIVPIRRPDGTEAWIELIAEPFNDIAGEIGSTLTLIDRSAEREATSRSERLARMLEVTTDLVAIWDEQGRLLHVNHAFLDFFRPPTFPFRQEGGTMPALFYRGADHLDTSELGRVVDYETELTRWDGTRVPFSVVAGTFEDATGHRFHAGLGRDISESRANAERLQDLIRAKDEFVASVSHELRTPLTAVVGMAHELSENSKDFTRDQILEFIHLIAEQSSEISSIVDDLLTVARAEAGVLSIQHEPVELSACIADSLRSISADFRLGIPVEGEKVWVRADAARLRQIVRNLLTNARRYGGPVVEAESRLEAGLGVIEVRDNGAPISPEEQARMFEAYGRRQRRRTNPDSVGLGLTVARHLCELMGGTLVYVHEGGWSRFIVRVPLLAESAAGRHDAA